MGAFRQRINDYGNSSLVKNINEWNPLYHGANALSGLITGKDIVGEKMGGGSNALAALGAIPGEGKIVEKVGSTGFKSFPALKRYFGEISKYTNLADKTHKTAATFNKTTSIQSKIMFNDITKGFSKKVIITPKGKIVKASVGNNMYIQMRNFDKNGSHTTFDFINNNRLIYEFKFNK
jgi:hypothetical protein